MLDISVIPYRADLRDEWNAFVEVSRNGSFFHNRNYMEYHAERFADASIMLYCGSRLHAVLPASKSEATVTSHAGLTFGGLIYGSDARSVAIGAALDAVLAYFRVNGFDKLIYRPAPHIFHRMPSGEDLYFVTQNKGRLIRRDLSSVIQTAASVKMSDIRRRGVKKAVEAGLQVRDGQFFQAFHDLLSEVLERHDASPVHSADEMRNLQNSFPNSISLKGAFSGDELLAASWVFDFGRVLHTQYLAASKRGREVGALDLVIADIISNSTDKEYLSFGVSTTEQGRILNHGLISQKEGFGARGVVIDTYEIELQ